MIATDYPALTDMALTRFMLVSTSAFVVLLVFGFRLRCPKVVVTLLLASIVGLSMLFPLLDFFQYSMRPQAGWTAGRASELAYLLRRLHWAGLGTACGLVAALLCGLAGRDLWRVR